MKKIRLIIFFFLAPMFFALPQSFKVEMKDIDFTYLPRTSFSFCVTNSNVPITNLTDQNFILKRNGVIQPFILYCPDINTINSIMFVLDNSASIGMALPIIKNAVSRMVDSLRIQDEAALITFSDNVYLKVDFTTDRVPIQIALNSMFASGNTKLNDAMLEGVNLLSSRTGKRFCIVITDGEDNQSVARIDSVIAAARRNDVMFYTIGVGPFSVDATQLKRAAYETGGSYYRIYNAKDLVDLFHKLREQIMSACCTGWFESTTCSDSIETMQVEYHNGNVTAKFDTAYNIGSHSDTLVFRVIAPNEIAPGDDAIVYIKVEPKVVQNISSSFNLRMQFNSTLLRANLFNPIKNGTLTEGMPLISDTGRGYVKIRGTDLIFKYSTGNLFGFRFKALFADSSRLVPITIDSISFTNGCPVVVKVIPDTIAVCQCKREVVADVDSSKYVGQGKTVTLPVRIIKGIESSQPLIFTALVSYDSKYLTPLTVESSASILTNPKISWHLVQNGIILIDMMLSAIPTDSIGNLFSITFKSEYTKEPISVHWSAVNVKVYQRCCPLPMNEDIGAVLVDGACDKIARRKENIISYLYNNPNPVNINATTEIRYGLTNDAFVRLEIFDVLGRSLKVLTNTNKTKGEYVVPFSTPDNAKGIFYYRLTANKESVINRMVIVK